MVFDNARSFAFKVPSKIGTAAHAERKQIGLAFHCFLILFCMQIYAKIRQMADEELEREVEWQIRSSKLNEIASLADTMRLQILPELEALENDRQWILERKGREMSTEEAQTLQRMAGHVEDMRDISQSFGWIYLSYRDEEARATTKMLVRHLEILMKRKAALVGWTVDTETDERPLFGPLPSLMLLLLTIAMKIMEGETLQRILHLEAKSQGHRVSFLFSWKPESACELELWKLSLVRNLLHAIKASIEEKFLEGEQQIWIQGNWGV